MGAIGKRAMAGWILLAWAGAAGAEPASEAEIRQWVAELDAESPEARNAAQKRLEEEGEKVRPFVEKALPSGSREFGERSREVLAFLDFRRRLAEGTEEEKAEALRELGQSRLKRFVPDLVKRARDAAESRRIRCGSLFVLELLEAKEAEEAAMECLSDPEPNVRAQAASALAKVGSSRSAPALEKLLRSAPGFREDGGAIYEILPPRLAPDYREKIAQTPPSLRGGKPASPSAQRNAAFQQGKVLFRGGRRGTDADPSSEWIDKVYDRFDPIGDWQPRFVYIHRKCIDALEAIAGKELEGTGWRGKRTRWLKREAEKAQEAPSSR